MTLTCSPQMSQLGWVNQEAQQRSGFGLDGPSKDPPGSVNLISSAYSPLCLHKPLGWQETCSNSGRWMCCLLQQAGCIIKRGSRGDGIVAKMTHVGDKVHRSAEGYAHKQMYSMCDGPTLQKAGDWISKRQVARLLSLPANLLSFLSAFLPLIQMRIHINHHAQKIPANEPTPEPIASSICSLSDDGTAQSSECSCSTFSSVSIVLSWVQYTSM